MARRLNIAIVDDGLDLCLELRSWLEEIDHVVTCFQAHRTRVSAIAACRPDLLILGVPRYSSTGLDLYRRLSAHRSIRHLPVIAVSEESSLEYELLDVIDFQVRPIDRGRLRASLERLTSASGQAPAALQVDPGLLSRFKTFLIEHSALHFNQRNQRLLERGLLRRIQALQMPSIQAYYDYLQAAAENFDELNKLLRFITVGETCFFRYRSHREALIKHVIPQLIEQRHQKRTLRIWSAGCSTGEEPYSLAILLLECFPELQDWNVQIFATDINKRALRQAREGIYGQRAVRLVEPHLLDRYFEKSGPHYRVGHLARSMVRFKYLNLQTDPFPNPGNQTDAIDLLFCRNVLIYFELETIRRIIDKFAECLADHGFLFLGHAETMQNVSDRYQRLHEQGAFFYQRKQETSVTAVKQPQQPTPVVSRAAPQQPASARRSLPASSTKKVVRPLDVDSLYTAAIDAFDHERFDDAERLFDQILTAQPKHPLSLVGKGLLRANQGDYAEARLYCAKAIVQDDLLPEAYLLRGLILDMDGPLERALVEYQKVLWLDNGFSMAHYLMAKAYARLGQPDQAARALRNTIRSLERNISLNIIPFSGGLSRGVFLDIVHRELAAAGQSR